MSLGGGASTALDDAVTQLHRRRRHLRRRRRQQQRQRLQLLARPASPDAITVGATTSTDARASFSNFGTCVDIFAPGVEHHVGVEHQRHRDQHHQRHLDGDARTSPARRRWCLARQPGLTPRQVRNALVDNATTSKVDEPRHGLAQPAALHGRHNAGGPPPAVAPRRRPSPPTARTGNADARTTRSTAPAAPGSSATPPRRPASSPSRGATRATTRGSTSASRSSSS